MSYLETNNLEIKSVVPHYKKIPRFLLIAIGLSLPFSDIEALHKIGGSYLGSIAIIPLALGFIFVGRVLLANRIFKNFMFFGIYCMFVTLCLLFFRSIDALGEDILWKTTKQYTSFIASIPVLFLGITLDAFGAFPRVETSLFHGTLNTNMRLRGFDFEASALSVSVLTSIALSFIDSSKKTRIILTSLYASFFLLFSNLSRGAIFCTILGIVIMVLHKLFVTVLGREIFGKIFRISFVTLCFLLSNALGTFLQASFWQRFKALSSDLTRSVWADAGWYSIVNFPLGQGFGTSLQTLPTIIQNRAISYSGKYKSDEFAELSRLIYSESDKFLGAKNLLVSFQITGGIFGLFFGLWLVYQISKRLEFLAIYNSYPISVIFTIVVLTSVSFYGAFFSWNQAICIGVLFGITARDKQSTNEENIHVR
jgi:hypothetical protein